MNLKSIKKYVSSVILLIVSFGIITNISNATPFWKKLAGVVKLNNTYGYIDQNGKEINVYNKE